MEKNTKKRKKIIALSIGVLAVVAIFAGSTYAYWQITKTQETPNDIVAACLNFTIENEIGSFGLEDATPLTDDEGAELNGYTFSVENKCAEAVTYIVGLDALENSSGKYLAHENIKVKLDNKSAKIYGSLKDAGNPNVLASKQLSVETVEGKGTNTHNVKIWIKSDAPVSEQGKGFTGQVFITGGQGIEAPGCYEIADNGTIIGYDVACGGTDVVVPASIDGIAVKEINPMSFSNYNAALIAGGYGEESEYKGDIEYEYYDYIYYFKSEEDSEEFKNTLKTANCEDVNNCDIDSILAEENASIIIGIDGYNSLDWSKYKEVVIEAVNMDFTTMEANAMSLSITSLDLSKATELEKIAGYSFYGRVESDTSINDTCTYDSSPGKYYCNGYFTSVILPENGKLTEIGENAFEYNQFDTVTIPSTVKVIGDGAFSKNNIQNLNFADNSILTTIGSSAFEENKIETLDLPDSVQSIGDYAFENNNISEITLSAETIGQYAFYQNQLTAVTIKNTVQSIGSCAFRGATGYNNVTSLSLEDPDDAPSTLATIGMYAFMDNNLLTIKLPRNLERIQYMAFYNSGLQGTIIIPASVTTIETSVFGSNAALTNIIVKRTEADATTNMTLGTTWNGTATVTYDPDYAG